MLSLVVVALLIFTVDVALAGPDMTLNKRENDEVLLLNVGGESMYTTRSTLNYVPNTRLAFLNHQSRDNTGQLFLDLPPHLFKHFLYQLRHWAIRGNRSLDIALEPPSWNVKNEFDEMLTLLGFHKYRRVVPTECTAHKVVDDPTRRESSGRGSSCDDKETAGWTRFVDRAGRAIINRAPGSGLHGCGGNAQGWILGVYPSVPYITTIATMCYIGALGDPCAWMAAKPVRITHCGDFFVFDIPIAPTCPLRACTTD